MKTKVEYKTDINEEYKLICEKYWSRSNNKRNDFVHTCKEIAKDFSLSSGEISKIAKNNAILVVLDCLCSRCGIQVICRTRSELIQLNLDNWTCTACRKVIQQNRHEQYMAEIEKIRQKEIDARHALIRLLCSGQLI